MTFSGASAGHRAPVIATSASYAAIQMPGVPDCLAFGW
jgi:hypothetical protein